MPSSLEIVVASDSGVEPIGKFPPDLNVSYFHHRPPTSSANVKEPLGTYAGPRETREAGVFTRYISDRYDSLPDAVVFVHADIGAHNPVWLRWLYCLRRDVEFASLSPIVNTMPRRSSEFLNVMNNGSAVTTDGRISHYPARPGDRGHPHCCFLVVLSRRAILRHPRIVYEEADRALTAGKVNAFNFELQYHLLFQPERHEWRNARDVCATFQCERPACATKFIRFVTERGPLASGHSKKHVPVALLDWEDGSCGVQDLTQPEWRTVAPTVRERFLRVALRIDGAGRQGSMQRGRYESAKSVYTCTAGLFGIHSPRLLARRPRCSEEATYASHNITAKTVARSAGCAIRMLRRMRLAQLVRRLGVAHGEERHMRLIRAASRARARAIPHDGRRCTDASARARAARFRNRGHQLCPTVAHLREERWGKEIRKTPVQQRGQQPRGGPPGGGPPDSRVADHDRLVSL